MAFEYSTRPFVVGLLILALAHGGHQEVAKQSKSKKVVSTLLNAKWPAAPFPLETAEYLGDIERHFFWETIDLLAEEEDNVPQWSDKEAYEKVISFASRFISKASLKLLKFSLALRTKSPKLESIRQLAREKGVFEQLKEKDCKEGSFVLETGNSLFCSVEKALTYLKKESEPSRVFTVDHRYPQGNEKNLHSVVILYAQPGLKGFREIHNKLKDLSNRDEINYFLRPLVIQPALPKTRMSGYGVELQIKSTEYKAQDDRKVESSGEGYHHNIDEEEEKEDEVGGFVFSTLNQKYPDDGEKLADLKQHLIDQNNDMAPLKVWQLQDLSLQAAERIMSTAKDKQLKVLTDLAQNFPSHARSLSKTVVSKEMKKEVKKNQESFLVNMNLQTSDAALFINGMHFDMDYVDVFSIFDTLKSEGRVLDGLGRLGMTNEQARKMITQDFSATKTIYGIDIRDTAVNWINDIESDSLYKGWPDNVNELLRPTFPGMLRSIRKNFFNVVILCDPSKKESRPLLKLLESFYIHRAPTRIGIVFVVDESVDLTGDKDAGVAFVNAFNYISSQKSPYDALAFITDVFAQIEETEEITVKVIQDQFMQNYGSDVKLKDVFGEDSEYDYGRQLGKDYAKRSGFLEFPQVLMNGVPLEDKYLGGENFEEGIMMSIMRITNELQMAVYRGRLKNDADVLEFLMKEPNIMPRLNDRILKSSSDYIEMGGDALPSLKEETFVPLGKGSKTATLAQSLSYVTGKDDPNKLHVVSAWVVADLETKEGREMLRGAISHLKTGGMTRVAVINNSDKPGLISKIIYATMSKLETPKAIKNVLGKVLKEDVLSKLKEGKKKLADFEIPGADMNVLSKEVDTIDDSEFRMQRLYSSEVLNLKPAERAIVVNGKILGPLNEDESFGVDDFALLERYTMSMYGEKMVNIYYTFMDTKKSNINDQIMKIVSLLLTRTEGKTRRDINYVSDKVSVIKIDPKIPDLPSFDITAIIDPVSLGAQKVAPLLLVLSEVVNANIKVFLNCAEKLSEMPHKSYFRLVLDPEPTFAPDTENAIGPIARFANLPEEPIFTLHYHVPDNWLIEPVKSVYDLDNIKLSAIDGNVHSEFELEYLLLEGHCFEAFTGNPPRGLQLTLGTKSDLVKEDTIVMANLGYFQLKSKPGRWILNLREGRSSELYDIISHENTEDIDGSIHVFIDSFQSKIVKLKVQKKSDKRNEDLLESDSDSDQKESGLWSSIANTLSGSKTDGESGSPANETLNIFCLASGHLYERLLKIMMLSLIRHTNAPVKFWILKNYLSPSLKEFLPEYAKRYGFEYEYVQYQWPRWLHQQKEKQRIIWGYKILFLDVMFPLDVKKIIFVDTDQIIRADLTELRDMDLKGAPYGYTPFCDSNKDMEGFRFWKSGYWRNHLAGRPYHISALYVVDLVKFRRIAAGDRLRGQYQALSQDPNSLANLDQDLPNNMIHQVPIFSLPQEWLYCETWCAKSELSKAKSIDLCNNPLTKESKLDAARRIVAEWTDYDEEMQRLAEEIKADAAKQKKKESIGSSTDTDHKHTEL